MQYPLSAESEAVMRHAWNEAARLKHDFLGSEHILLGLIADPESATARILTSQRVTLARVREEVEAIVGPGRPGYSPDDLGLTDNALRILKSASQSVKEPTLIEPEHLLLELCGVTHSTAVQILCDLRASPDSLRKLVLRHLSDRAD